jgi:hypothetical protein
MGSSAQSGSPHCPWRLLSANRGHGRLRCVQMAPLDAEFLLLLDQQLEDLEIIELRTQVLVHQLADVDARLNDPAATRSPRAEISALVPRQMPTGGRTILGPISKRGNRYLRMLLQAPDWSDLNEPHQTLQDFFGIILNQSSSRAVDPPVHFVLLLRFLLVRSAIKSSLPSRAHHAFRRTWRFPVVVEVAPNWRAAAAGNRGDEESAVLETYCAPRQWRIVPAYPLIFFGQFKAGH